MAGGAGRHPGGRAGARRPPLGDAAPPCSCCCTCCGPRPAAGPAVHLFVVGTYRDTDIDRRHPLAATMAELRRLPGVERLSVYGLSEPEVEALIVQVAGHPLDDDTLAMAHAVYAETEGNPFFVAEVLHHLVETGAVRRRDDRWVVVSPATLSVPEGVRDVVGRRLSRLSPEANELLSLSSVIGREFEVGLLSALNDMTENALLDALDEACSGDWWRRPALTGTGSPMHWFGPPCTRRCRPPAADGCIGGSPTRSRRSTLMTSWRWRTTWSRPGPMGAHGPGPRLRVGRG